MITKKEITPAKATHPGILIKDELDATPDLNQKLLAKQLDVKPSFLNEIIKGKRPITPDIAVALEAALGISAEYWIRFQSQYEIDLARRKERNIEKVENIEKWKRIKEIVPVRYLNKHNYLSETLVEDIEKVLKIYNVATVDEINNELLCFEEAQSAYYRKSDKLKIDNKNMFAWCALAKYEAKRQQVSTFNIDAIDALIVELNRLFYENVDTLQKVKSVLNKYGIKFLLIEKLEKTPVDGFTFWSGSNPVIALSLRHNRIDNFAFTVMHEIGHIDLHLRKDKEQSFIYFTKKSSIGEQEDAANSYAQEQLISNDVWQSIKDKDAMSDDEMIAIGDELKINPAIILGRICYDKNNYARKTKIDKTLR